MKKCPFCNAEIASDQIDCGHHTIEEKGQSASVDPVVYAIAMVGAKLNSAREIHAQAVRERDEAQAILDAKQVAVDASQASLDEAEKVSDKVNSLVAAPQPTAPVSSSPTPPAQGGSKWVPGQPLT